MLSSTSITIIRPCKRWLDIGLRELWNSRELLLLLAKRDVSIIYKQTILGPAWFLIQPVLMALVFSVIFGRVAKISTAGIPAILFYLCGLMLWNYFRSSFEGAASSFRHEQALFTKVYFHRMIVPIAFPLSNLVYLGWNLVTFLAFYAFHCLQGYQAHPTLWILLFPVLIVYTGLAALGPGLLVAALTVKYRDLTFALPFLLQIWMYSTPIIFSLQEATTPWIRWILLLNPATIAVEGLRIMFFGTGVVTPIGIIVGVVMTLLSLVLGAAAFNRAQYTFVDTF